MINLFTTYYNEKNPERAEELRTCLINNSKLKSLNNIYTLSEIGEDEFLLENNINVIRIFERPSFNDFFRATNAFTSTNDINIIANADIYFDKSLNCLTKVNLSNSCFALTRWDVWKNGRARLTEISGSQDCWIFKGKINNVDGNFHLGIPGCDNRLAHEIKKAGYNLFNPSISIRAYHLHQSAYRPNSNKWFSKDYAIGRPHATVIPDTLESFNKSSIFTLLMHKKKLSDYLYKLKIQRWYNYKICITKYNQNLANGNSYNRLSKIRLLILKYYFRIPVTKYMLMILSPVYYKKYLDRR